MAPCQETIALFFFLVFQRLSLLFVTVKGCEGTRFYKCLTAVQAGDVLLLDTGAQFWDNHKNNRNFALVAEVANSRPPRLDRVVIAVLAAVAAIGTAIAGVASLFTSAAMASAVMLLTGCLSGDAARKAVKWDILVTIAAAFGISTALEKTGGLSAKCQVKCFCVGLECWKFLASNRCKSGMSGTCMFSGPGALP
jgi:hypothetical protein